MRLYIIRHGDPDYAINRLTQRGREEAGALAQYLPRLGITHLYTSPYGRARETCALCAKTLGLEPVTLNWARELDTNDVVIDGYGGFLPYTLPAEVSFAINEAPACKGWETQQYYDNPAFNDCVHAMEAGADALLEYHGYAREGEIYRVTRPAPQRVALFCHQGLGTTLIAYLLHIPYQAAWGGMWQACTGISTLTMECYGKGYAMPRLIGMGETTHIALAGLEPTERGLVQKEY